MALHLLSPLLYAGFVKAIEQLPQVPKDPTMIWMRKAHNIHLSVLSALMLVLATVGTYQAGKFDSFEALLCDSYAGYDLFAYGLYVPNRATVWATKLFLWSKYIEWGDTLFLHLSNRPITWLQYTHHMTTALLTYVSTGRTTISPHILVFMGTNCLVHIPMYWYFAYPDGFLKKYRKTITQSQIVQHLICIACIVRTSTIGDCKQAEYANELGFCLYMMYLIYFGMFYVSTYFDKQTNRIGENKSE